MHLKRGIAAAVLALALAVPACAAGELSPEQRREDLDALYSTLRRAHPNLFANTPEADFLARRGEIEESLARSGDQTFVMDLQSLAALAGDSHTTLSLGSLSRLFRAYPLSLIWRDGGWYLAAAPEENRDLLGREVLRAAGIPTEQAVQAFGALLSADNPVKLRRQFRQSCNVADFYEYLGLVGPLELELEGGESLSLSPVAIEALGDMEIALLGDGLPQPATAVRNCNYCAFALDGRTFYIQYNTCAEDKELPMAGFAAQVEAALEQGNYSRIVVDLRSNGGGSDGVIWPLFQVLRRAADRGAELAGLIGETTFSSAVINAVELQEMGAVLVGEAASGSVDHFGSVKSFSLPNSGLRAGVSSKYIDLDTLLDAGAGRGVEALEPDVTVPQTMEDTLAGRDSAVEWLLSNPQRLEQRAWPDAPLTRGRFAALLWRQAGSPPAEPAEFSDTLGIEWFLPALDWVAENRIASGGGDGAFAAVRPITREEAAVMLARFAGLTGDGGTWSDGEETSAWARQAVGQVLAAGLMETEGGAFRPQAGMTRAEGEAAALLAGNRVPSENK